MFPKQNYYLKLSGLRFFKTPAVHMAHGPYRLYLSPFIGVQYNLCFSYLYSKECLVSSSGNDNTENGLSGAKNENKGTPKA